MISSFFLFNNTQGYKQSKAYIIDEGPMESTTRNIWKVVYDKKCGAVIMLSDLMENGNVYLQVCFLSSCLPEIKSVYTFSVHLLGD